jgi:serine/threonine-protein kinase RsbT
VSSALEEQILRVLRSHVSTINARSILRRAKARVLGPDAEITRDNASSLFSALRTGIEMFSGPAEFATVAGQLQALISAPTTPATQRRRVEVRTQEDISAARRVALEICTLAGAQRFAQQRITTAVSELARNIADYSLGGFVEISQEQGRIVIIAEDRGPGIAELDRVLSGTYRSRTGLGRGLRGVRQMMDHTQIETGPDGTRITTEVTLWT